MNSVRHASRFATLALGAAVAAVLAGCNAAAPPPAASAPAPAPEAAGKAVASVIDLMKYEVDPAADSLWEAVASVATPKGMVDRKPSTDKEWEELRGHALRLAEAANLLMMPGRRVAHEGQTLDDDGVAGNFTQAEAQHALETEHATFAAFARTLQDQAVGFLGAIERRDVDAYLQAGGDLDEACEACHKHFWYPGGGTPAVASAAAPAAASATPAR